MFVGRIHITVVCKIYIHLVYPLGDERGTVATRNSLIPIGPDIQNYPLQRIEKFLVYKNNMTIFE